ncbi:MAG: hypothetical protein ACOYL6_15365 [Bacteriovoracaceae bacterium]
MNLKVHRTYLSPHQYRSYFFANFRKPHHQGAKERCAHRSSGITTGLVGYAPGNSFQSFGPNTG